MNIKKFLFDYYLLDLLQIIQFTIVALFLSVIFSIIYRFLFERVLKQPEAPIIIEFIYICIQTVSIIIILILIKSIMNNIPSIADMINNKFDGTYALRTSTHIAVFFALMELIPSYKKLFDNFSERLKIPNIKYKLPNIVENLRKNEII